MPGREQLLLTSLFLQVENTPTLNNLFVPILTGGYKR